MSKAREIQKATGWRKVFKRWKHAFDLWKYHNERYTKYTSFTDCLDMADFVDIVVDYEYK